MDIRQTIAARVRALLAKTTEAGATEAEAMAAANKARELMDKYQLDLGAIGMEAEGCTTGYAEANPYKNFHIRWRLAHAVKEFCDCKAWAATSFKPYKLAFFGLRSDVEFAEWLIASLEDHVRRSAAEFMLSNPPLSRYSKKPRWQAEKDFMWGCLTRISERLKEATNARKAQMQGGTGTSLIVVKGALVDAEYAKLGHKLRGGGNEKVHLGNASAYDAGKAAGDRASFGRPVNGGSGVLAIGGR